MQGFTAPIWHNNCHLIKPVRIILPNLTNDDFMGHRPNWGRQPGESYYIINFGLEEFYVWHVGCSHKHLYSSGGRWFFTSGLFLSI